MTFNSSSLQTIEDDKVFYDDTSKDLGYGFDPLQNPSDRFGRPKHESERMSEFAFGRESLFQAQMQSFKEKGSYELSEDVYAFIIGAPVMSVSFAVALLVILMKYIVYTCLLYDIDYKDGFECMQGNASVVKFVLIPVAVAMQEDLMAVFAGAANARYSADVLQLSNAATRNKYALGYLLRTIDAILSLAVNFLVMMQTDAVLNVFLNFAALHFLQDIDDVFYALIEKGFFGDDLEEMSILCRQITFPRRRGSNKWSAFLTNLDSIFFGTTVVSLYIVYIYVGIIKGTLADGECPEA